MKVLTHSFFPALFFLVVSFFSASLHAVESPVFFPGFNKTGLSVRMPNGWSCALIAESEGPPGMQGDLRCRKPGSEFSEILLTKFPEDYAIAGLRDYLRRYLAIAQKYSHQYLEFPRLTKIGRRKVVESVSNGGSIVGGTWSGTRVVTHDLVFKEDKAFYRCYLKILEPEYRDSLRDDFLSFCASVVFSTSETKVN